MAGHKIDRATTDIQREIAAIMREMKDPRVNNSLLSVVKIKVSNDLSYTTVYISSMNGIEAAKEAVEGLKHAAGYVRTELGNRLKMRKSPELKFVADDSIEYSAELAKKIDRLNKKDEE